MLQASFLDGLAGVAGKHVRYASHRNIEQALSTTLAVQEAENQETFNETFYTRFDDSVRLLSRSPFGRVNKTEVLGAQLTRKRSITCAISATGLHAALASHQTLGTGMSRRKQHLGAMNAKGWATLPRTVLRG
jgi:hypothetical protein